MYMVSLDKYQLTLVVLNSFWEISNIFLPFFNIEMAHLVGILSCGNKNQFILHHDDIIKWKHFQRYWPFVRGIHRSPVNSPHKGQWHGALMFSLICSWTNGWVNNREASNLRHHLAHYDVTEMIVNTIVVDDSARSQGISSHDIGLGIKEYSSFNTRWVHEIHQLHTHPWSLPDWTWSVSIKQCLSTLSVTIDRNYAQAECLFV